jgi:hypothetical protein
MIIAVDFDGTLHIGQWPTIGLLAPDAAKVMRQLKEDGHYLIIWTCREGERQTEAINWLLEKGILFDRVNDNHPDQTALYNNNSRKIYAHLYIDDKNLGGFPGWLHAEEIITQMELKYQQKAS